MNFKKFVDLYDFDDAVEVRHKQKQKIKPVKEDRAEDKQKHRNRVAAHNFKHGDFK
jgi:hypothetical protein